jgi:hypothetical protein
VENNDGSLTIIFDGSLSEILRAGAELTGETPEEFGYRAIMTVVDKTSH